MARNGAQQHPAASLLLTTPWLALCSYGTGQHSRAGLTVCSRSQELGSSGGPGLRYKFYLAGSDRYRVQGVLYVKQDWQYISLFSTQQQGMTRPQGELTLGR